MPSLRQLLAAHTSVLLLDAASARIQVGWLTADAATTRWAGSDEEAGVGLFRCLAEFKVKPSDAGALVFCDGPGSVLGIRTAAMALRAWRVLAPRPVYGYHSLALVAAYLNRGDVTVIADARREQWHALSLDSPLQRVRAAGLTGELVMPEGFRHWAPLPAGTTHVPYSLAAMLPRLMDAELLGATDEPDAFLHEEPSYATWTPQIHRAP